MSNEHLVAKEDKSDPPGLPYVRVLVWPAVVLIALFIFRAPISDFLRRTQEVKFDAKGLELKAAGR